MWLGVAKESCSRLLLHSCRLALCPRHRSFFHALFRPFFSPFTFLPFFHYGIHILMTMTTETVKIVPFQEKPLDYVYIEGFHPSYPHDWGQFSCLVFAAEHHREVGDVVIICREPPAGSTRTFHSYYCSTTIQ